MLPDGIAFATMSSSQPLLSITIPTYNRAPRLSQCLEMLRERIAELPEPRPAIEVLVIDNASTDDTAAVAARGGQVFEKFRYVRNERNLGIDGNIHRCTQLARGEWIQMLSDDDLLLPGALVHVFATLQTHTAADFVFLNVLSFVNELPPPGQRIPRIPLAADLVCTDPSVVVETCRIWMTFLSSFVVRRSAWNRSQALERYIGTDIYLTYALFDLLSGARESVILARPLVAARGHFSGSYRIFYAFGYQWTEVLLRHAPSIGFDAARMRAVLRKTVREDLTGRVLVYRMDSTRLNDKERANVRHAMVGLSKASTGLWLAMNAPLWLLRAVRSTRRALRGALTS
jgi:abequosyltransferase